MTDAVQRGLVTFLSAWLLLHESAHEVIEDFVEKGTLQSGEGDGFMRDLSRQVAEERDHLKAWLKTDGARPKGRLPGAGGARETTSLARADQVEMEELLARLDRLEGQMAVLDSRVEALSGDEAGRRSRK